MAHENAYIILDDTVLDKRYSKNIELTRRQYSGNEHGVLRGIGLVSCILWVVKLCARAPLHETVEAFVLRDTNDVEVVGVCRG